MSTASTRLAPPVAGAVQRAADVVLTGGTVRTFDAAGTVGSALAVRDGRIALVGDDAEALALAGDATNVVDLTGRTAIPGINDSHLHGAWLGSMWPDTLVSPDGQFQHDGLVDRLVTEADHRAAIRRTSALVAELGITSYTEPGLGPGEDDGPTGCFGSGVLAAYRSLAAAGELTARVTVLALFGLVDGPSDLETFEREFPRLDFRSEHPDWLRLAGVKIFADGIPPMRSAWTRHVYDDGSTGDLLVRGADIREKEANLRAMLTRVQDAGLQVGVHATGDRSIETVVDELGRDPERARALRHYVIHGDLLSPALVERMLEAGVGINAQSGLAGLGGHGPAAGAVLPPEALGDSWVMLEALRAGVPLCLSSDSPVQSPDWRRGIRVAAELIGDAWPERPGAAVPATADARRARLAELLLRCYTVNPARQDGAESWKGTLEAGKAADICVLAEDPFTTAPAQLPEVPVELTIAGGRVTFERG